jgi:hypothetical protein
MNLSDPIAAPITGRFGIDGNRIFGYSLLLCMVEIGLSIAYALLRKALELPRGSWDKIILVAVASFAVYWMMARRHPAQYFANGISVAVLTGLINAMFSFAHAFDRLATPSMIALLFIWTVMVHVVLFLVVYLVRRSLAVVDSQRRQQ